MKLLTSLSLSLFLLLGTANSQVVVIVEEDFEGAEPRALDTGNAGATLTEVDDPEVGGTRGTVAAIDLSGGNQWGAVAPSASAIFQLPVGTVPGVDTFTVTMDVFIPADTTFSADDGADGINLIQRFNDGVDNNPTSNNIASNNPATTLPRGEWFTISIDDRTIPEVDRQDPPAPVSHVVPILSFRDTNESSNPLGTEAGAGIALYFDNYRLEVTVPVEDPNLGVLPISFGSDLDQSTGPHVEMLQITNTGTSKVLTITGATLTGADSALFTVTNTTFPLMIDVGETAPIELTFSPADASGTFSAALELASNDENDATVSVALSAAVLEPFEGRELILNGSFESGDLTYWRDNNRFDYSDVEAHTGEGSAVFNLAGGQEWGEARVATIAPPAVEGDGNQERLAITPDMHGKEYSYRAWYFRPETGGMGPEDEVMLILRWNGINGANHTRGRTLVSDFPTGTWIRVVGTGTVPALDADEAAVTSVIPLWSFHDLPPNDVAGGLMYIDSVSLKVDVPPLQPESAPEITSIEYDETNDLVRITWTAIVGAKYALDRDTQMSPVFNELEDTINATSETMTYEDAGIPSGGETRLFYRVRLVELP